MFDKPNEHHGVRFTAKILDFLTEVTVKNEGPGYVYDTETIARNCDLFTAIPYAPKSLHFATMANIHPRFLGVVRNRGMSAFVNSLEHLKKVLEAGFSGEEVVFTASGMDDETMKIAREYQVRVFLDSLGQVERWRSLFPGVEFGLRCNIGDRVEPRDTRAGVFLGQKSRLGLTREEIETLQGDPLVTALHLYPGTDIKDIEYFLMCYEVLADLAELFPELDCLNFGGGFSVASNGDLAFDMTAYAERVTHLMEERSRVLGRRLRLLLEPGRIIGCDAGFFFCRVTDVKYRGECQFIGVSASSTQFPRPLFYPDNAFHPCTLMRDGELVEGGTVNSSVFGCSTYSRDFLARETPLPQAQVGDWVVLGHAGSYSAAAHTRFLGFPPAKEVFL